MILTTRIKNIKLTFKSKQLNLIKTFNAIIKICSLLFFVRVNINMIAIVTRQIKTLS